MAPGLNCISCSIAQPTNTQRCSHMRPDTRYPMLMPPCLRDYAIRLAFPVDCHGPIWECWHFLAAANALRRIAIQFPPWLRDMSANFRAFSRIWERNNTNKNEKRTTKKKEKDLLPIRFYVLRGTSEGLAEEVGLRLGLCQTFRDVRVMASSRLRSKTKQWR